MLNTMSLAAVALALTAQLGPTYPDALDTLRGADTTPQIQMVVDSSCSMGGVIPGQNPSSPLCPFFSTARITTGGCSSCAMCPADGACTLSKMDMLQASLTGCQSPTDGILFQWASRVMFAIRAFGTGGSDGLIQNGGFTAGFDTSMSNGLNLMAAVNTLVPTSATPLGIGYAAAGAYQSNHFSYDGNPVTPPCGPLATGGAGCNNTLQCRQNYLVVMSDGSSNGGNSTYNFVPTNGTITVSDGYAAGPAGPYADYAARYMVRDLADNLTPIDAFPNVVGNQQIRTYTVAFDAPLNAQQMLNAMAFEGEGSAYNPSNYQDLSAAFQSIILNIVARSNVSFNPGTVQNDGFFSGNYIYTTSFRPFDRGYWLGTTKKYCVDPTKTKPGGFTNDDCLFIRVPAVTGPLFMNDNPRDVWTDDKSVAATTGGTGGLLAASMGRTPFEGPPIAPASPAPGPYYSGRRIMTWDPGTSAWLAVDPYSAGTFNPGFTKTSGQCAHRQLVNKLYGYADTNQGPGCGGAGGDPVNFEWPIGDTVNGSTALIRYTDDCESPGAQCYLAVNANDGMLHLYNARTGLEISAIIPGELWDASQVNNHQLRDIMQQPDLNSMRKFYFDGKATVYHADTNANGFVDGAESAFLIVGLGRGGKAYYRFDVGASSALASSGDLTSNAPASRPQALMIDAASGFGELRDTWAEPWIGRFNDLRSGTPATRVPVAVFPSGHDREYDVLDPFGGTLGGLAPPPPDSNSSFQTYACGAVNPNFNIPPEHCSFQAMVNTVCAAIPAPMSYCDLTACTPGTNSMPVFPTDPVPCYDWAGWGSFLPITNNTVGYSLPFGSYTFNNGGVTGIAYRINFTNVNLQDCDYLEVMDGSGNVVDTIGQCLGTGAPYSAANVQSSWIYDTSFRFRLITDGTDDAAATGWTIGNIDYQRSSTGVAAGTSRPSIYVVDVNTWNGNGTTTQFARPSDQTNTGVVAALMSDCTGSNLPGNVCIDATNQPDLALMNCPISADVAVFAEGGVFRTGYVGDQCGQIFAFDYDPNATTPATAWRVRRLAHFNNVNGTRQVVAGHTKDFRKIFSKLDLVVSTCTGPRRIGVYFGTGNEQRPALDFYLRDANVSSPSVVGWVTPLAGADALGGRPDRDVLGVVWDDGTVIDRNLTNLLDVTTTNVILDPSTAPFGYYIQLGDDEKMLSNPLVLDGIAYFQTYTPVQKATECVSANGVSVYYAFDNCNAGAALDQNANGQPESWERTLPTTEPSDGGGEFLLYAPPDGPPQVFTGKIPPATAAPTPALPSRPTARSMRLYLWRLSVEALF